MFVVEGSFKTNMKWEINESKEFCRVWILMSKKKNWKCLNFLIIIIIIYFLYIKQSIYSKGHKVEFSEIASN